MEGGSSQGGESGGAEGGGATPPILGFAARFTLLSITLSLDSRLSPTVQDVEPLSDLPTGGGGQPEWHLHRHNLGSVASVMTQTYEVGGILGSYVFCRFVGGFWCFFWWGGEGGGWERG